jgi:hypothetical protein
MPRGKAWQSLKNCRVEHRHLIKERVATKICGITFEAFPVEHSLIAPAVGYRVKAGRACIFYGPDLIFIHGRSAAMKDVRVYIGDGATFTRSFIRKRGERLIGHAAMSVQIGWCAKEGVPRAIITHCGSEIVTGDERKIAATRQSSGRWAPSAESKRVSRTTGWSWRCDKTNPIRELS